MSSPRSTPEALTRCLSELSLRTSRDGQPGSDDRSYLDFVPDDVLENIIRNVSLRPRRTDWASFIPPDDVRALYNAGGPVAHFCRRRFTTVSTRRSLSYYRDGALYLNDHHADSVFPSVLAAGGAFRFISFSHRYPRMAVDRNWVALFERHCTAVRRLDISGIEDAALFDAILAVCGPRLRALAANCSAPALVASIAAHCAALDDFKVVEEHAALLAVWRSRGPRLKSLAFDFGVRNCAELEHIARHCRALRQLRVWQSFDAEEDLRPRIAALYASYGEQLDFAVLEPFDPAVCRSIARACPNVRLKSTLKESIPEVMLALGPRLTQARFLLDEHTRADSLREAARACLAITEMNVLTGLTAGFARALLSGPRDVLTVLSISDVKTDVDEVLAVVGDNTSSLSRFSFNGLMPSQGAFRGIVANNAHLEHVDIRVSEKEFGEDDSFDNIVFLKEEIIVDVLKTFIPGRSMKELVINDNSFIADDTMVRAIAETCNPYRFNRVHVRVSGHSYLP